MFLGVCETICVPVQAKLTLDPASDPDNPDDAAAVAAAFSNIPPAATPDFGVKPAGKAGDAKVVLEAAFPGKPESAELFIAARTATRSPRRSGNSATARPSFLVEVTRPDEPATGAGLHYTLVTDAGAVSGLLPYF